MSEPIEYCQSLHCRMVRAEVLWHWIAPGVGTKRCDNCGHLYAAINCPYIPEFMKQTDEGKDHE